MPNKIAAARLARRAGRLTLEIMIDRKTAPHYSWGAGCDGWHLVESGTLSVIEESMPPGTAEVQHHHQKANQFFYVLRGALSMEVGGNEFVLDEGQGVHVSAGEVHRVSNRSAGTAEFLVVSSPPSHGDRVV